MSKAEQLKTINASIVKQQQLLAQTSDPIKRKEIEVVLQRLILQRQALK